MNIHLYAGAASRLTTWGIAVAVSLYLCFPIAFVHMDRSIARPSECAEKLATAFGLSAFSAFASAFARSRNELPIVIATPSVLAAAWSFPNDSAACLFSFSF